MANSYLQRSGANSGASGTTATVSMWVRKLDESAGDGGFFQFWSSGSNFCSAYANPVLKMRNFISGGYSQGDITCNRKLRDNGSWYHLQCVWDTTNSTAGDRMRIYINGVRETSFSSSTNPSSSYAFGPLESGTFYLNRYNANTTTGSQNYSHVHYCDGYAYEPTVFGETDSTTGQWEIITSPSCSYGSNGFFILKDGNSTTDQSGNNKTFSITGTLTNTEDNPSNVFATLNPLVPIGANFSNGNLTHSTTSGSYKSALTTLGVSSGKWYCEVKYTTDTGYTGIGVANFEKGNINSITYLGDSTNSVSFFAGAQTLYYNAGNPSWTGASCVNGDIIGIALDIDNGFIYWHKNGTYMNSGVPTSGATGTGGYAISNIANSDGSGTYAFGVSTAATAGTRTLTCNFGNGYFATTAISSEGTNASGIGKFEYDVPAGYAGLSTKGLNL